MPRLAKVLCACNGFSTPRDQLEEKLAHDPVTPRHLEPHLLVWESRIGSAGSFKPPVNLWVPCKVLPDGTGITRDPTGHHPLTYQTM